MSAEPRDVRAGSAMRSLQGALRSGDPRLSSRLRSRPPPGARIQTRGGAPGVCAPGRLPELWGADLDGIRLLLPAGALSVRSPPEAREIRARPGAGVDAMRRLVRSARMPRLVDVECDLGAAMREQFFVHGPCTARLRVRRRGVHAQRPRSAPRRLRRVPRRRLTGGLATRSITLLD